VKQDTIHSHAGLVDVCWRDDLAAVYVLWHSEYDEGTAVKDAIVAAIDYVNKHNVKNWLADISRSSKALSEDDYNWVSGDEFRNLIRDSSLEKFVLIPPLPETGQDTSWLAGWEANTLKAFGDGVSAKLSGDMDKIRMFFNAG